MEILLQGVFRIWFCIPALDLAGKYLCSGRFDSIGNQLTVDSYTVYPYGVFAPQLPDVYQNFWIQNQVHRQLTVKEEPYEGHYPPGGVVHGHRCASLKVLRSPALDVELTTGKLVVLPQLTEVYP